MFVPGFIILFYFVEIHGFLVNSSDGGGVRQLSSSFDTKHNNSRSCKNISGSKHEKE